MGRRGPAKTATVIQLMRGDPGKRAKRQFKREMKAPQTKALKCPKWLSKEGRAVWRRVVRVFGEMEAEGQRLLTDLDVDTLGAYCQAVADLAKATREIERDGEVIDILNEEGQVKYRQQSPYVGMRNKAYGVVKQYAQEFGFTPSARGRIEVSGAGGAKAKDDFGKDAGLGGQS